MSAPAPSLTCLILAAGLGTRLQSDRPKVLHPVGGVAMLRHVISAAEALAPQVVAVVVGPDMPEVAALANPHTSIVQTQRLGTGHAVLTALRAGVDFGGDVLVLFGDTPLVQPQTLHQLIDRRRKRDNPAVVVAAMTPADPARYGRLITTPGTDEVGAIVEYADATVAQRAIAVCNAGFMVLDGPRVAPLLAALTPSPTKGELYLTDLVALARAAGHACVMVAIAEDQALGANSRAELAVLEGVFQRRLRNQALLAGVGMVAPDTVQLSPDTRFGRDVMIDPYVIFGPGVVVEDGAHIRSFSHLEGAHVGNQAVIGPYARLREGTVIGAQARVGNFVETKKAVLGDGAKANHLSYLGDASIGAHANIGAGTITCNYDGFNKHETMIGDGAFIGSNSALVAPVTIGAGAVVAAGSVITRSVPEDALALARAPQIHKAGWASAFRTAQAARKRRA